MSDGLIFPGLPGGHSRDVHAPRAPRPTPQCPRGPPGHQGCPCCHPFSGHLEGRLFGTGFILPWYRESPGHAMALGLPRPQHDTHRRRGRLDSAAQSCVALGMCIVISHPPFLSPVAVSPPVESGPCRLPGAVGRAGWLMCGQRPARGTHSARGGHRDDLSADPPCPQLGAHTGASLWWQLPAGPPVSPGLWLSCSLTPHRSLPQNSLPPPCPSLEGPRV